MDIGLFDKANVEPRRRYGAEGKIQSNLDHLGCA
jgi:hypothetical protein